MLDVHIQVRSHICLCHQWNSGWPIDLTAESANSELAASGAPSLNGETPSEVPAVVNVLEHHAGDTTTDQQYINGLGGLNTGEGDVPAYMGAVSPWFFTHYGVDSYNKNVSCLFT